MVTQEMYDNGIRCRGMCIICHEKQGCIQYENETTNKPPLGLTPKNIWIAQRMQDIIEASNRYYKEGMEMPIEWIEEYNELVKLSK